MLVSESVSGVKKRVERERVKSVNILVIGFSHPLFYLHFLKPIFFLYKVLFHLLLNQRYILLNTTVLPQDHTVQ